MRDPENMVAAGMRSLAEETVAPALPDPGAIWLRAQWHERRQVEERALRPIAIAQKVAVITASLGLPGVAVWYWPAIHSYAELRWLLGLGFGLVLLAATTAMLTAAPRDLPPESGGRP